MPELGAGLLGCYRCGYVWRLRKSPVRLCPRCKSRAWDLPARPGPGSGVRRAGLGIEEVIGPSRTRLRALAAEYGATDLRVFGSVARGDARPTSDVDLLVRFPKPIGLLARMEFKERAAHLLRRPVDIATEHTLHWLVRPRVLDEAVAV